MAPVGIFAGDVQRSLFSHGQLGLGTAGGECSLPKLLATLRNLHPKYVSCGEQHTAFLMEVRRDCSLDTTCLPDCSLDTTSLPDSSLDTTCLPYCSLDTTCLPDCSLDTTSLPDSSLDTTCLPYCSLDTTCLPDYSLDTTCLPDCCKDTANLLAYNLDSHAHIHLRNSSSKPNSECCQHSVLLGWRGVHLWPWI